MKHRIFKLAATSLAVMSLLSACGSDDDSVASNPPQQVDPDQPDNIKFQWFGYTNHHLQIGKVGLLMDAAYAFEGTRDNPAIAKLVLSSLNAGGSTIDYMVLGHDHGDHSIDTTEVQKQTGAKYYAMGSACTKTIAAGGKCETIKGGEVIELSKYAKMYAYRFIHGLDCPATLPANGGTETIGFLIVAQTKTGQVALTLTDSGIGGPDALKEVVVNGVNLGSADGNLRKAMQLAGVTKLDMQLVGPEKRSSTHAATWLPQYQAKVLYQSHIGVGKGLVNGVQRQYNLLEGLHYKYQATDSPQLMKVLAKYPNTKFVTPDNYFDAYTIGTDGFKQVSNSVTKRMMGLPEVGPGPLPQSPTNLRSRPVGDVTGIDCPIDDPLFAAF